MKRIIKAVLLKILVPLAIIVCVIGAGVDVFSNRNTIMESLLKKKETEPVVVSTPMLEQIVKESKISTFTAVYNGIAIVPDSDNPDEISYYVSYKARVNAGFNLDDLKVELDEENPTILKVTIPEITLDTPNVDISSFDRMNVTKTNNLSDLNGDEYRICEEDAKEEASNKPAIKELATQNAKNVISGLLKPFLDGENYTDIVFDEVDAS